MSQNRENTPRSKQDAIKKLMHQQKNNQKLAEKQKASVVEIPHFLFHNYTFSAN